MRYFAIVLLSAAAFFRASAQDATPANQTSKDAPLKQVVYEDPGGRETITITGTDTLVLEGNGQKIAGKYTAEGKTMHADWTNADAQGDAPFVFHRNDYDISEEGLLYDTKRGKVFATAAAMEKAKDKMAEIKCLSNAKQIALACRLYASDNNGNFPPKLDDLVPTYLEDKTLFISPLSAKKEALGYDYFGFGGTDSDAPNKILLRSRDTTPDGRRIVVYFDSSGEIKLDK